MNCFVNYFFLSLIILVSSCSYISGPEGFFPETKDKFFDERLFDDLKLPSSDKVIKKDDHYPPITKSIKDVEIQDIPPPRQIFSLIVPSIIKGFCETYEILSNQFSNSLMSISLHNILPDFGFKTPAKR